MLIAVIGLGGIAERAYLPVLGTRGDLDLLLCSRKEATIRRFQADYRASRAVTDIEEVIRSRPTAAFVLTPNETHAAILRQLLAAGIDVFVEKPATLRSAETQELAELADRRGRLLMVGFNRRFAPLHRQARGLLGGPAGPISLAWFEKERTQPSYADVTEQFIDDTIHQIDLLRYYCGEAEVVSCVYHLEEGKVASTLSCLALEQGGMASIATSSRAGAWKETYRMDGGGQSILVEAFSSLQCVTPQSNQTWQETYASSWKTTLEGRGFTGQITHFLSCIQNREQPETTAWDSVKTQLLLEKMADQAVPV